MCIAIYLPKNKTLTMETLLNCAKSNPDGFGYGYFKNGIKITKNVKATRSILNDFINNRLENIERDYIVHFRIATTGKISNLTTHPFVVNRNLIFCHNGILSDFSKGLSMQDIKSDTMEFNSKILQKLPTNFIKQDCYKYLLEEAIGICNKMILLQSDGTTMILNEKQGHWDKGIWYSNHSYLMTSSVRTIDMFSDYGYTSGYSKILSTTSEKEYYNNKTKTKYTNKHTKHFQQKKLCVVCGAKLFTATECQNGVCWDCTYHYNIKNEKEVIEIIDNEGSI